MIRIIIPTYNEEGNIADTIRAVDKTLSNRNYKIYVVNDGSSDKTASILKKLKKSYPVGVLTHKTNLGVAEAFKTGINAMVKEGGSKDIVVIMEADGTSDPNLLLKMIDKINSGCDLVIASRYLSGGGYKGFPIKRLIFSRSANFILRYYVRNKNVTDCTIFYRAYSLDLLIKAQKKYGNNLITTQHFTSNAELLFKLSSLTQKVCEIPFIYDYSKKKGKSGLKIATNLKQYFFLLSSFSSFPGYKKTNQNNN